MINLSQKAAKRFRIKWKDLEQRSGDFWKIDMMMIGRVPMLLIVHEATLFTMVKRKAQFGSLQSVADEITKACSWYPPPPASSPGKNGNNQLTGSINEMKRYTVGLYSLEQLDHMERSINECLYSYLAADGEKYGTPIEAVERYKNGETPWLEQPEMDQAIEG